MIKEVIEFSKPILTLIGPFMEIIGLIINPRRKVMFLADCLIGINNHIPTITISDILGAIIFIGFFTKFIIFINKKIP